MTGIPRWRGPEIAPDRAIAATDTQGHRDRRCRGPGREHLATGRSNCGETEVAPGINDVVPDEGSDARV